MDTRSILCSLCRLPTTLINQLVLRAHTTEQFWVSVSKPEEGCLGKSSQLVDFHSGLWANNWSCRRKFLSIVFRGFDSGLGFFPPFRIHLEEQLILNSTRWFWHWAYFSWALECLEKKIEDLFSGPKLLVKEKEQEEEKENSQENERWRKRMGPFGPS